MLHPSPARSDRLRGGILGLLVGDALGVPYEFHPASRIPAPHQIEYTPPDGFDRAHASVPPGTWSDDGATALCLLDSLLACNRLDIDDLARRLVNWYEVGYMAVDNKVFDVGIATGTALRNFRNGTPAIDSGPADVYSNGNGSLMRVLPLALWHMGDDEQLAADAQLQSRVTHGHLRSQVCCALYCLWTRYTLREHASPWQAAVESLRRIYRTHPQAEAELEFHIRPDDLSPGKGSGYVVDCLRSARWAAAQGGFEVAARAAISLGHDTDTTACVAGGLIGVRDGASAIPTRWIAGLRGREVIEPLISKLCERRA